MNKMAVSLRINASVKDFDFSFDEVLLELIKMFNKGGIVKIVELIFNWISIILAQNFESLILPVDCFDSKFLLIILRLKKLIPSYSGDL